MSSLWTGFLVAYIHMDTYIMYVCARVWSCVWSCVCVRATTEPAEFADHINIMSRPEMCSDRSPNDLRPGE